MGSVRWIGILKYTVPVCVLCVYNNEYIRKIWYANKQYPGSVYVAIVCDVACVRMPINFY